MNTSLVLSQILTGLLLPILLIALLIVREFVLISADPRWNKAGSWLLVPIAVLFLLFLIQVAVQFGTFERQEEYRGAIIQGLEASIFSSGPATPTPYMPAQVESGFVMETPSPTPWNRQTSPVRPNRLPGARQLQETEALSIETPPSIPVVTGIPEPEEAPKQAPQVVGPDREYPYLSTRDTPY
jgi:hypothetical protein